ncbi:MAG TPA: hypothetical protein VGD24_06355 [Gallionella sp.]
MDETAYRQVLTTSIGRPCPFEKSILTCCAACVLAEKHNVAEREVVACGESESHALCVALRDALRHNFTFAVGRLHIDGPLPHAQEMRLQCGGLRGMQFTVDGTNEVNDVSLLVRQARRKFGELADYPYSQIVHLAQVYYRAR